MSKQYGLIIPGKKPTNAPKADFTRPSIFGSDSDSDDQAPKKVTRVGPGANEKRQARRVQEKALEEDPTIFQYDELYDDIESKRNEEKNLKSNDARKPKYIGRLLEYAERRKIENERRVERTVQKEREKEGEEFKDKEAFVTSAYRKKLEELREAEEREKREDYLEAIGDVTKQQDLGGFYRHLYEQKLKIKEEKDEAESEPKVPAVTDKDPEESSSNKIQIKTANKARAYRKRRSSDEDESEVAPAIDSAAKKIHLQSNIDADSDFSIDSSTDSDEEEEDGKKGPENVSRTENLDVNNKENPVKSENEEKVPEQDKKNSNHANESNACVIDAKDIKKEKEENDVKPKVPKINKKDIWKKRTVGEVFDAALARYYERKAARKG